VHSLRRPWRMVGYRMAVARLPSLPEGGLISGSWWDGRELVRRSRGGLGRGAGAGRDGEAAGSRACNSTFGDQGYKGSAVFSPIHPRRQQSASSLLLARPGASQSKGYTAFTNP
jgi:hypothetical protein